MSCNPVIECNVKIFNYQTSTNCWLCDMQQAKVRIIDCGGYYPVGDDGRLLPGYKGHKTKIWIMNHGGPDDGQTALPGALHQARSFFFGASSGAIKAPASPRGHFVLRYYTDEAHDNGHWGLEYFDSSDTMPFVLSDVMANTAHDACLWFFDPEKILLDPEPARREISPVEIRERLEDYQKWIDAETGREYNQRRYRSLPPLIELPEEQQRRLVYWWDRLWFDWLDLHPAYLWTPTLGFWRPNSETIYYLQGPTKPVDCASLRANA